MNPKEYLSSINKDFFLNKKILEVREQKLDDAFVDWETEGLTFVSYHYFWY